MNFKILFLATILVVCFGSQVAKIYQINSMNIDKFTKDGSYWFIQVSQGKCPECLQNAQLLQETAYILQGAVKVGKINSKLLPSLKFTKNPTYIFTRSDDPKRNKPYLRPFKSEDISHFCLQQLSGYFAIREMQKEMREKQSQEKIKQKPKTEKSSSQQSTQKHSSTVIELNDKMFQQKVLKSNDAWLVQFYSPGCGHCKNFQPQYSKLPKLIGKRVHISRIDGSKNQQFMGKYKVKGFPTVLLFETKDKSQPVPYEGQRTASAVVEWLITRDINEEKRQLLQLTKQSYIDQCNKNIVCMIFILNKKSDKSKLGFLAQTMAQNAQKPLRFFYSERLQQFEYDLMISDREAPILVSIWNYLNSYKIYNGPLNHEDLTNHLKTIFQRKSWIKYQTKMIDGLFSQRNKVEL